MMWALVLMVLAMVSGTIEKRLPVPIYGKQAEFLKLSFRTQGFVGGFVGGRGTGKTRIGAYNVMRLAKNTHAILCVSPDAGVVTETTLPTFLEVSRELGVYINHKLTPYPKVWFRTQDGGIATIVFRSGEKPKKLEGPNYAMVWIDEASLQAHQVFLSSQATLRHKGTMGPMQLTFTPKGKSNWTFGTFFKPISEEQIDEVELDDLEWFSDKPFLKVPNTGLIQARSSDNPFNSEVFEATLRQHMSAQLAQQELGGEFIEMSGMMFQRHWFEQVDATPREATRVRYWDKAATPGSGCETAGLLMAHSKGVWYIEDLVHGHWSANERDAHIVATAEKDHAKYGGEVVIYAEQEGGSAGKEVMEGMIRMLAGYSIHRDIVSGNKMTLIGGEKLPNEAKVRRAMPLQSQAEANNVKVLRASWTNYFLDQIVAFPESTLCDAVDAASGAFNKLTQTTPRDIAAPEKSRVADYQLPATKFGALFALDEVRRRAGTRRLFDR